MRAALIIGTLLIGGCANAPAPQQQLLPPSSPLALTAQQIAIVEAGVRASLRDPESARFSGIRAAASGATVHVCGRVNSKNGYGGYGGPKLFYGLLAGRHKDTGTPGFFPLGVSTDDIGQRTNAQMCARYGIEL